MGPARITELLRPFLAPGQELSPHQLQQISTYIDLLLKWNARINLTAVRDPEEIVTRHFGESLFVALHLFPATDHVGAAATEHVGTAALGCPAGRSPASSKDSGDARRLTPDDCLDIGSGAGFPGLPIKLWAPHLHLTLIESNNKKATFLREAARALTLTDVNVFAGRAEDFSSSAQLVTLRAVERFEKVLPVAAGLVAPAGRLALLVGLPQVPTAQALLPTLRWDASLQIPLSESRVLLIAHRP